MVALESDVGDVQGGTTQEGIHMGVMAGTLDLIQRGYLGTVIRDGVLHFDPKPVGNLDGLSFPMQFRGTPLEVSLEGDTLAVASRGEGFGPPVEVRVGGEAREIEAGETLHLRRSEVRVGSAGLKTNPKEEVRGGTHSDLRGHGGPDGQVPHARPDQALRGGQAPERHQGHRGRQEGVGGRQERLQAFVLDSLESHARDVSGRRPRADGRSRSSSTGPPTSPTRGACLGALQPLDRPILAYLALPPAVFAPTIEALKEADLPEGSRVAIEKPFGENLESAQELNRLLHGFLPEKDIFRVDHFLAWQPFPTIMGLRFANGIFEPLWDRNYIERVEIHWEETLALEGRAGYFDHAGAFKDLIQNHLLQLLCLTAMEAPTALHRRNLRDRKVDLLRSIRRSHARGGRNSGPSAPATAPAPIGERHIPAYADEEGVDPGRETETFAQVTFMIDNLRWAGVPFVLRGGKALSRFRGEIAVHFKPVPHLAFQRAGEPQAQRSPPPACAGQGVPEPERQRTLRPLRPGPDRAERGLRSPGVLLRLRSRLRRPAGGQQHPLCQGRRGRRGLAGSPSRYWTPGEGQVPLLEYPAGSDGPDEASLPPEQAGHESRNTQGM